MKSFEVSKKITNYITALADETDAVKKSKRFNEWLKLMARFHKYSYYNTISILMHQPGATYVMGFRQWKAVKRFVNKGESGIPILFPMWIKDREAADPDKKKLVFKVGYVFDITQTDGEPLDVMPDLPDTSDHQETFDALIAYAGTMGLTVNLDAPIRARGNTNVKDTINIRGDASIDAQAQILLHEIAHNACNHVPGEQAKRTVELEAESVAYVVGSMIGLPINGSSIYLASHDVTGELLKGAMDKIMQVSQKIYNEVIGNENGRHTD